MGHFMTIFGHFFANFMFIYHKTEVQTVILRTDQVLNWNKFYNLKSKKDQKRKNPIWAIFYKISKNRKWKYLDFVS